MAGSKKDPMCSRTVKNMIGEVTTNADRTGNSWNQDSVLDQENSDRFEECKLL